MKKKLYEDVYSQIKQYGATDHEIILIGKDKLPEEVRSVIHVGVGKSRLPLAYLADGKKVSIMDIAFNAFDEEVKLAVNKVYVDDITRFNLSIPQHDYVVCVDVLEHIDYCALDAALLNLKALAPHGVLAPSITKSKHGLHDIVENASWWEEKLSPYFKFYETNKTTTHFIGKY